jgi:hypothetical protein
LIEIPQSIKNLPDWCFNDCSSISKIIFHEQLESFGDYFWKDVHR